MRSYDDFKQMDPDKERDEWEAEEAKEQAAIERWEQQREDDAANEYLNEVLNQEKE